jgi:hypothetical protein
VIITNTSSVFFQAIIEGTQDAASQAQGVTVIPMGSTQDGDLAGAIRTLEDALSRKLIAISRPIRMLSDHRLTAFLKHCLCHGGQQQPIPFEWTSSLSTNNVGI